MKSKRSRSAVISSSRWTAYATAGAATAVVGGMHTADAAIHYVSVNQTYNVAPNSSIINSFSLGAGASFAVRDFLHASGVNGHASFAIGAASAASFVGYMTSVFTYPRYVSKLGAGQNVGGFTNFVTNYGYFAYLARHASGAFNAPGIGYIGIRFNTGAGVQYGWIRLNMNGAPGNSFTLVDYAWGDPGDSILTGQVPEPGSLGLLALGAVGLLAWRKRRAQTAAQ